MQKRLILVSVFLMVGITFIVAQTPVVKNRQINQQKRIQQGVRSGELTKGEAYNLQMQQVNVQRTKKRAKADGVVTKREKAVIHHKQNKANLNIYRKKHNGNSRG